MPAARPVAKVLVCVLLSLLIAIQALEPREKAIRLDPSSYQLATAAVPASLCQPTMLAMPWLRSVQTQVLEEQSVLVTKPLASAGGESSELLKEKPE